jgi:hypothetical protein
MQSGAWLAHAGAAGSSARASAGDASVIASAISVTIRLTIRTLRETHLRGEKLPTPCASEGFQA